MAYTTYETSSLKTRTYENNFFFGTTELPDGNIKKLFLF